MIRFLHSSDLHIGKPFGNMPEDLRGRLREARHQVIGRLAAQARAGGASVILLAGDTFDTETPTPSIRRQALAAMGEDPSLQWVLLPGNHDSLLADELWSAAGGASPGNVLIATEAAPLPLSPNLILLPSPCTTRRPGRDLTEWMSGSTAQTGGIRIGLAHGPVRSFSEDGVGEDVIAPDRALKAGLDYLALGDWHGQVRINDRCWYSGAPEPDRFKHNAPGQALLVTIEAPGALPDVQPVGTASFAWRTLALELISGDDPVAMLDGLLPPPSARRDMLLRVMATGWTRPRERTNLAKAIEEVAPDFAHLDLDTEQLATECDNTDLDLIDRAGALRQAAEALLSESADTSRTAAEREVARAALIRLFSYCEASRS